MSRILRSALAIGASTAAIAAGVAFAVTPQSTTQTAPRTEIAAAAAPAAVQIKPQHSGQCLTVPQLSLRNGVGAVQSPCAKGALNQQIDMVPTGAGTFELRFKHSGKCLDVQGWGTTTGTSVQQFWCLSGQPNQQWRMILTDIANDQYELVPAHLPTTGKLCLDVTTSSKDDGAAVRLWACNGTSAQKWSVAPAA
ncbi:RICIN domain-containing protein [Streptomyces sp. 12297]|uniref:RICIN domain-containing protein n=1 Tax=Streptomyces sp. NBC_00239 TaxID=2903640 RepID=UPI002E2971F1|nr:RICIN domain-containing protein [Streptomyces sp. NBC_00239]